MLLIFLKNFFLFKERTLGIMNVDFIRAGFLFYVYKGELPDRIISCISLHHFFVSS